MRIGAVGAALKLVDGNVFVHKRSPNVTHAKNMIDSSVAGLAHYDQSIEKLNFQKSLLEKLHRELKINDSEVKSVTFTGVHSSYDPDFSGMVDFALESNLEKGHIEERIDRSYFSEHYFVPSHNLSDFIIDHFAIREDMIGDGCATLLASLDHTTFIQTVDKIREYHRAGDIIDFGRLENGFFIPEAR